MLRTLDAIHLATALLIREDIETLLTYDDRLAARGAGSARHRGGGPGPEPWQAATPAAR